MIWIYEAIGAIRDFIELGGNVLWAIMFVLFLMWTFILERLWYYYKVHPARKAAIIEYWEARADTASWYAKRIREGLVSETSLALRQNVGLIKVLIAICPLLGLLGTVTGMIAVFDVMTYSGGGNARAMAGGVSMATVPTMAGMVAALSGVYFGTWLEHKAQVETEKLEDLLQSHG
ncbi:MotA/TolQ/ExbB proton channel family protein [Pseudomonadota bacterium]